MLDLYAGLIQINIVMVLYLHGMQMFVYRYVTLPWDRFQYYGSEYPYALKKLLF